MAFSVLSKTVLKNSFQKHHPNKTGKKKEEKFWLLQKREPLEPAVISHMFGSLECRNFPTMLSSGIGKNV